MACAGYDPLPYRTGYEEVIGTRVDELFVITADFAGVVTSVKADSLTVEFVNNESKVYDLGIRHGTVTGVTIPHMRITDMVVGQKFNQGDALIFNSGFFTRSELNPANVVYKAGAVSRVALLENADTIEDGSVISEKLASKLATNGTTLHGIIMDFDTVIHNLVKVGDMVEPETILCSLENYIGDDLVAKDAEAIRALSRISANNPKAKVYGRISAIEVLYFGNIENMHFSLQQIATTYDNARAKRVRLLSTDDAKTGKIDESIRVSGKKVVAHQAVIKIYIDGEITMGSGDKLVFGNALKSTCSRVSTDPIISKDGLEVDAIFGYQSISDRIVCSPEISGIMNTVLKELSKQMGQRFLGKYIATEALQEVPRTSEEQLIADFYQQYPNIAGHDASFYENKCDAIAVLLKQFILDTQTSATNIAVIHGKGLNYNYLDWLTAPALKTKAFVVARKVDTAHVVLLIGDTVYDLSSKQFYSGDYSIYTLAEFKKRWLHVQMLNTAKYTPEWKAALATHTHELTTH